MEKKQFEVTGRPSPSRRATRPLIRTLTVSLTGVIVALTFAACGSSSGGDSTQADSTQALASTAASTGAQSDGGAISLPASIKAKGVLDIATFYNYPPYTYVDDAGQLQGIEAELMRAIAGKLGVKPEFHDMKFEAMIPSVINGRNDIMIGSMADTAERRKQVSFVDLWKVELDALVRKGNPAGVDPADLCGAKVTVTTGSFEDAAIDQISAQCVSDGKNKPSVLKLPDPGATYLAVLNGRSDTVLLDSAVATYAAKQNPKLEVLAPSVPAPTLQYNGWIVGKDNSELEKAFVQAIEELAKDGTWQKILETGGIGTGVVPPLVNNQPADS